jgi:SPP1 family predicted phage head-tail adaptor
MKAGSLDRVILIERPGVVMSDVFGVKTQTWATVATLRAQKLSNALINKEGVRGDVTDNTITFRTRFVDGVNLECRVTFEGNQLTIQSITELGRRVGLDITCLRVGP